MAVSKRTRFEVLRRDGFRCRYCGATPEMAELTIDHVTPVALGGTDEPTNLVTACEPCNSGKTSTTPDAELVADVAEDAARWAAAMEQAAANLAGQNAAAEEYRAAFTAEWERWTTTRQHRAAAVLPDNWRVSVEQFRASGLPATSWPEVVELAMGNHKVASSNVFRYCCGVAWNKVHALQKEARRLLAGSEAVADDWELSPDDEEWLRQQADLHDWAVRTSVDWRLEYRDAGHGTATTDTFYGVQGALYRAAKDGDHQRRRALGVLARAMGRVGRSDVEALLPDLPRIEAELAAPRDAHTD